MNKAKSVAFEEPCLFEMLESLQWTNSADWRTEDNWQDAVTHISGALELWQELV